MANAIEIAIPEGANFLERLVPPNMHGSAHMGPFIYLSNVLGMQEAWGISAREETFDQRRKNNNECAVITGRFFMQVKRAMLCEALLPWDGKNKESRSSSCSLRCNKLHVPVTVP